MENVWDVAAIRVGLALVATLLAIWLKLSTALSEIVVGTVAQLVIGTFVGAEALAGRSRPPWRTRVRCFRASSTRRFPWLR